MFARPLCRLLYGGTARWCFGRRCLHAILSCWLLHMDFHHILTRYDLIMRTSITNDHTWANKQVIHLTKEKIYIMLLSTSFNMLSRSIRQHKENWLVD